VGPERISISNWAMDRRMCFGTLFFSFLFRGGKETEGIQVCVFLDDDDEEEGGGK